VDTKDSLMDELVKALICLRKAHAWWDEEARYLTEWVGDEETGDEQNIFDGPPAWVKEAYTLLNTPPEPVSNPPDKVLLTTAHAVLYQGDVDILNGSVNRNVRIDITEDVEVKRLYEIWKSL